MTKATTETTFPMRKPSGVLDTQEMVTRLERNRP